MWRDTASLGLRLAIVLILLATVFAGVVYLTDLDMRTMERAVAVSVNVQVAQRDARTAAWADEVRRDAARQLAAPFLWNIETLAGVDEGTAAYRSLQRRMWQFVYGRDEQPAIETPPVGPLESVVIVDLDHRIVVASDVMQAGLTYTDLDTITVFNKALQAPQVTRERRPDGREVSILTVAVPNAQGQPIGFVRMRYAGGGLVAPETPPPVSVRAQPRYWGPVLAGILALLGVGFGAFAVYHVANLTRRLKGIAQGGDRSAAAGAPSFAGSASAALSMIEERIEVLEDALGRDEPLAGTLGAALQEGMVLLDADGTPIVANGQARRLLGLAANDLAASFFALAAANTDLSDLVDAGLRGKEAVRDRRLDLVRSDGTTAHAHLTTYLLHEDGATTGIVLLVRDSASIETLGRNLREASRLQSIVRLSGSVAHEVKNPLGAIGIHLEHLRRTLQKSERPDPASEERVQIIRDEIGRLREVLEEWLRLTSPDDRVPAAMPVGEIVSSVARLLRVEARHQQVELAIVLERDPGVTTLPAPRLRQVLLNLCLNALQAMPDGGRLVISAAERGGNAVLEIEDSGAGIPEDVRGRVFDVHFTTRAEGSGLGLAICRRLVEESGGTITFTSEVGRGTTFRIELPLAASASTAERKRAAGA